ncbi:MAG: hypothetical protein ABIH66_02265 [bacterium]
MLLVNGAAMRQNGDKETEVFARKMRKSLGDMICGFYERWAEHLARKGGGFHLLFMKLVYKALCCVGSIQIHKDKRMENPLQFKAAFLLFCSLLLMVIIRENGFMITLKREGNMQSLRCSIYKKGAFIPQNCSGAGETRSPA